MSFRIADYSETTSSPAGRDFASSRLVVARRRSRYAGLAYGNLARGGQDLKIAQLRLNVDIEKT